MMDTLPKLIPAVVIGLFVLLLIVFPLLRKSKKQQRRPIQQTQNKSSLDLSLHSQFSNQYNPVRSNWEDDNRG